MEMGLLYNILTLYISAAIMYILYHKTRENSILIFATGTWLNGLITALSWIVGYGNIWVYNNVTPLFILILFMMAVSLQIIGVASFIKQLYIDKMIRIGLILNIITLMFLTLSSLDGRIFYFVGTLSLIYCIYMIKWYKNFPLCRFNPFEC